MSIQLPDDLRQFVDEQLAAGRYDSETDLLTEAVRRLRDQREHFRQLKSQITEEISRIERGEGVVLNSTEELGEFLDAIDAEVDAEIVAARRAAS
jgi:putative addiction module CopG family antidote